MSTDPLILTLQCLFCILLS